MVAVTIAVAVAVAIVDAVVVALALPVAAIALAVVAVALAAVLVVAEADVFVGGDSRRCGWVISCCVVVRLLAAREWVGWWAGCRFVSRSKGFRLVGEEKFRIRVILRLYGSAHSGIFCKIFVDLANCCK